MNRPSPLPLTGPSMIDKGRDRALPALRWLPLLVAACALLSLGGCSYFKKKDRYVESGEIPAMRVPGDLDTPGYDPSLTVPAANEQTLLAGSDLAPPPLGSTGPGGTGSLGSGRTSVSFPDTLDNGWRRVGQAIERSGAFAILERNREEASYKVGLPAPIVRDPRPWWQRTLGWGDEPEQTTSSEVMVRLSEQDSQIRVDIYDLGGELLIDDRAKRVIAIVEDRLGLG